MRNKVECFYYDDDQTTGGPLICKYANEGQAKVWARTMFNTRKKQKRPVKAGILYRELSVGEIRSVEEYGLTRRGN